MGVSCVRAPSASAARVRAPCGRASRRSRAAVVPRVAAEGSSVDAACIVSYEETAAGDAFYAFHHDDPSCPETRDLLFSCDGVTVYGDSMDEDNMDDAKLADPVEDMELVAVVHADDDLEEVSAAFEPAEPYEAAPSPPVFVSYHEEAGCFEVCLDVSRGIRATGIVFEPGPDGRPFVTTVSTDGNAHGEVIVGDVLMETSTVELRESSLQQAWHDTKDSSFTESMAAMRKCADTLTMRMCRDYAPSDVMVASCGGEGSGEGDDGRSWAARMAGAA